MTEKRSCEDLKMALHVRVNLAASHVSALSHCHRAQKIGIVGFYMPLQSELH